MPHRPSIYRDHLLRRPTEDATKAYGKLGNETDSYGTDSATSGVRDQIFSKLVASNLALKGSDESATLTISQPPFSDHSQASHTDFAEEVQQQDEIDRHLPGLTPEKKQLLQSIFQPQQVKIIKGFGKMSCQVTLDESLKERIFGIVREFPDVLHNLRNGKFSIIAAVATIFERVQIQSMKTRGFDEDSILPFIEKSLYAVEVFLRKKR